MTDTDEHQDRLIRMLSAEPRIPSSVSRATGPAADDLRRHIMAGPRHDTQPVQAHRRRSSWSLRRRLVFAVPVAAALAVLAFAVTAILPEASIVGPPAARADALEITRDKGYIDIRIA